MSCCALLLDYKVPVIEQLEGLLQCHFTDPSIIRWVDVCYILNWTLVEISYLVIF